MTIDEIRNEVAVNLSRAVQEIGPMPDVVGEFVKDALKSNDKGILDGLDLMICRVATNRAWPKVTTDQLISMIRVVLKRAERQLGQVPVGVEQQVRDVFVLSDLKTLEQLYRSLMKTIEHGTWDWRTEE